MAQPSTRDDFDFLERAGRGASSVVFKARRKADGNVYCVKEIDMSAVVQEEEEQALREVQLLASFEHPYVIRYYDSFLDDEILHIVMEWAEHGTLGDRLKTPGGDNLSEPCIWKWSLQIIVGLNHMHNRKVLHRDLKSANVFITSRDDAKIGDLGVSRALNTMQEMAHTVVGTPYYLSPELCEGRPYNVKSDVWALGCIIFEMCSGGAMPFQASNQGALILKILSGKQAALPHGRYSADLDHLITRCLTKAWQRRPDTTEILARQDVVHHARELDIALPGKQHHIAGEGGLGTQEAAGRLDEPEVMLSRLHSAPAAPQSREGGQRPSYFGSEENDGTNIYRLGSGELCPLNDSSGDDADAAGGKFPSQLLVDDKRDAEPSVAPAANGGRRKGRRANLARSSLDMGLIHAGENDWNVQGQSARDHSLEQAENRGRGARGKNRPARDTDHLGGRHPRPPVGGSAATAGNHLQEDEQPTVPCSRAHSMPSVLRKAQEGSRAAALGERGHEHEASQGSGLDEIPAVSLISHPSQPLALRRRSCAPDPISVPESQLEPPAPSDFGRCWSDKTDASELQPDAMFPQSPGAARLEMFANDMMRPPGRHARRRDRGRQNVQKVGISTVDLTPKGARAHIASREAGGAIVRTPKNTKGLAVCTSPAAFPAWDGPTSEHPSLVGLTMMASPCSRLVMERFGPRVGLTRDDSGIGLRSPDKPDEPETGNVCLDRFPWPDRKSPRGVPKDFGSEAPLLSDVMRVGASEGNANIFPAGIDAQAARGRQRSQRPPHPYRPNGGNGGGGLGNNIAWGIEPSLQQAAEVAQSRLNARGRHTKGSVDELDHFLIDHIVDRPRGAGSDICVAAAGAGWASKGGDKRAAGDEAKPLVLFGRVPSGGANGRMAKEDRTGKLLRPGKLEAHGQHQAACQRVGSLQAHGRGRRDRDAAKPDEGAAGGAGGLEMLGQRLQF